MIKQCDNCPQKLSALKCVGLDNKLELDLDILNEQINQTLNELYFNDYDLLVRKVDERCISHRFAHYFENKFESKYPNYFFDIEYQRDGENPKYYSSQYARPDFMIHRRNCNKHNLVIFELKPFWSTSISCQPDYRKLEAFTSNEILQCRDGCERCYRYSYGVHIVLNKLTTNNRSCTVKIFKDGRCQQTLAINIKPFGETEHA